MWSRKDCVYKIPCKGLFSFISIAMAGSEKIVQGKTTGSP